MTGADQDDILRGAAGNDIMDGGGGVRHCPLRPAKHGSAAFTHGAFVNLSASSATYDFNGTADVVGIGGQGD